MTLLKYWRVWIVIVCLVGAMFAIGSRAFFVPRNGVEIIFISDSSPAKGVLEQGDVVTHVNGAKVTDINEWARLTEAAGTLTLTVDKQDYKFSVDEGLGITVISLERTNLDLGLDIRGGTRILLEPASKNLTAAEVQQVVDILETRANIFGLKEIKLQPVESGGGYLIRVESAGVQNDAIRGLLAQQGKFEAKITRTVRLDGGQGTLKVGQNEHAVEYLGGRLRINGNQVAAGDEFSLDNITFEYTNATGTDEVTLYATVYTGDDIELVYTDPQNSGIQRTESGYIFFFAILVSQEGAQRFSDLTEGIPSYVDLASGERYLQTGLHLFLDGKPTGPPLRIAADLGGTFLQNPQIQGGGETLEEASQEKLGLQTILKSGALPTSLNTVSLSVISPTLGHGFLVAAAYSALIAVAVVFGIAYIRYRRIRIALPMIFIVISEIAITIGIAATNDAAIWISVLLVNLLIIGLAWWKLHETDLSAVLGALAIPFMGAVFPGSWVFDLAAIGGIIAAIGTGIDDQLVIADEALHGRKDEAISKKGVLHKIKSAFFIVFGSAATLIAAMIPLVSIGTGLVRGFAITTIVGVLVGVLVTRPAYAKIVENVVK